MTDPAVLKIALDAVLAALAKVMPLLRKRKDKEKVSKAVREMLSLTPEEAVIEGALEGVQDKTRPDYIRAKSMHKARPKPTLRAAKKARKSVKVVKRYAMKKPGYRRLVTRTSKGRVRK